MVDIPRPSTSEVLFHTAVRLPDTSYEVPVLVVKHNIVVHSDPSAAAKVTRYTMCFFRLWSGLLRLCFGDDFTAVLLLVYSRKAVVLRLSFSVSIFFAGVRPPSAKNIRAQMAEQATF